jgi:hypothetical protein
MSAQLLDSSHVVLAEEVAREVHAALTAKIKRLGSGGNGGDVGDGAPKQSPREGAVKISTAVRGRGLLVDGDGEEEVDPDDGDYAQAGLLGIGYDSDDSNEEGNNHAQSGKENMKNKQDHPVDNLPSSPGLKSGSGIDRDVDDEAAAPSKAEKSDGTSVGATASLAIVGSSPPDEARRCHEAVPLCLLGGSRDLREAAAEDGMQDAGPTVNGVNAGPDGVRKAGKQTRSSSAMLAPLQQTPDHDHLLRDDDDDQPLPPIMFQKGQR